MTAPTIGSLCSVCGLRPPTGRGVTCSKSCAARLRESRKTVRGRPRREYAPELVAHLCGLYEAGMTVAEVSAVAPAGVKVQLLLERHLPTRRSTAKRNQYGPANSTWRGDEAGYAALHLRVDAARGKPSRCDHCERTDGRFEWANLTGRYEDVDDYARLCVGCHRKFDAARRRLTGERTMPAHLRGDEDV